MGDNGKYNSMIIIYSPQINQLGEREVVLVNMENMFRLEGVATGGAWRVMALQ